MRIHIVTPGNRGLYGRQLEEMHRQRKTVFIDKMGWSDLQAEGGAERDQFDEAAFYLLLLGDVGEVLASARLLPTWKPHLFSTILSGQLDHPERASGPGVWEVSRWIAGPGLDEETDARCRALLFAGLAEFTVSCGVDAVVASVDEAFLRHFKALGTDVEIIGGPNSYGQGVAYAVRCEANADVLLMIRKLIGLRAPAAFSLGAWMKPVDTDPTLWAIFDRLLEIDDPEHLDELLLAVSSIAEMMSITRSQKARETVKG